MKKVLFDSDVLLDVLAKRQPYFLSSTEALNTVTQGQVEGYISGHAVTNIFYILRRQVGSQLARDLLSRLLEKLKIASVTDAVIKDALQSPMKDFEDAVTSAVAKSASLEVIITRNIADFAKSSVQAMLPEDFLAMLSLK